jgi:hypothetical protein
VTHGLGVRVFGTQLLCEQVIGRTLRRQLYDLNEYWVFQCRIRREIEAGFHRLIERVTIVNLSAEEKPKRERDSVHGEN